MMLRSVTESSSALIRLTPGGAAFAQWWAHLSRRNTRRRLIHTGLIALNAFLLFGVLTVVIFTPPHGSGSKSQPAALAADESTTPQPLDALASVNVAVTIARMANLPEEAAVSNQSDSAGIQLAVASTDNAVVNKPQAVSSAYLSNKDIRTYTALSGDTVSTLATKFGVSSNSILWSNGLTGDRLAAGKKLVIPPLDGIVYTVKAGDTAASLATKYRSNEDKIVAYNDAEIGGIKEGEQIIIPDGQIVATTPTYYSGYSGFAWGTSAIYGRNGYDWGNCTWYVATQIAVPANWGNAATWAAGARSAGWHVSSVPTVGAIAQNSWMAWGLGHVGIVDAVSADGRQVLIREMNGAGGVDGNGRQVYGGFGTVDIAWQPTGNYPNYITR